MPLAGDPRIHIGTAVDYMTDRGYRRASVNDLVRLPTQAFDILKRKLT